MWPDGACTKSGMLRGLEVSLVELEGQEADHGLSSHVQSTCNNDPHALCFGFEAPSMKKK